MATDGGPGGLDSAGDFHEIKPVKSRGLLIGDYLILQKLGQGGMGEVYKARHCRSGRVGVLKMLPPSFARDRGAISRFRRDIEAAGRLRHPNVVTPIDSDEDRGVHFLVMDYVEGRDLDRLVRTNGPMPVAQAVDCVIQAARGLEAAHAQGIIHRDIKPGNLILDTAGTVRVLDLGLARIVDANTRFGKTAVGRSTQSSTKVGTDAFMAPEQAEDARRVDHRADIYSLGCTLYFLLTGQEPFPGETLREGLKAQMEREAPSLRAIRPDVHRALEACYQKMMAKQPDDRPRSMTEVIARLQASKLPPDTVTARDGPPPKHRPEQMVFDETPLERAGSPETRVEPSIFARREEREGVIINHDFNLEDLVMEVRSDPQPGPIKTPATMVEPLLRRAMLAFRRRPRQTADALVALAAGGLVLAVFLGFLVPHRSPRVTEIESPPAASELESSENTEPVPRTSLAASTPTTKTIFGGTSAKGWMLCNRVPLPPTHIQPDGLNPHGTGSYLVVYDQKFGDFVLDFDYKLTRDCNSGVFVRVSDLNDPIKTGIEVSLDDTRRGDDHDSGALYGLVAPRIYTQKPSGQWNHMTIVAQGPRLTAFLNGTEVSSINLDLWTLPGKRPDGSEHGFQDLTVAHMARSGYVGFQDLGGDCWYKNIVVRSETGGLLSAASASPTGPRTTPSPVSQHINRSATR